MERKAKWRDLTDHIFDIVVKNLPRKELSTLSRVCFAWNLQISWILKNERILDFIYVDVRYLKNSIQHYNNLLISRRVTLLKTLEIIEIVKNRRLPIPNAIKSVEILGRQHKHLQPILAECGDKLSHVGITFDKIDKCDTQTDNTVIPSLVNVTSLRMCGWDKLGIHVNFQALETLHFTVQKQYYEENISCLKHLVTLNKDRLRNLSIVFEVYCNGTNERLPFLEEIYKLHKLSIICLGTRNVLILNSSLFEKKWPLVSLTLKPCFITNNDVDNIYENFKKLQHIFLKFHMESEHLLESLGKLWTLPDLKTVEYSRCYRYEPAIESINTSVTYLGLEESSIVDRTFLEQLPVYAPALQTFKVKQHYLDCSEALFDNLQKLDFLTVLELNVGGFKIQKIQQFPRLEELILGENFPRESHKLEEVCWNYLEVPNLKVLRLKDCSRWDTDHLAECLQSCQSVERLYVNSFRQRGDKILKVIKDMPNLELLSYEKFTDLEEFLVFLRVRPKTLKNFIADLSGNKCDEASNMHLQIWDLFDYENLKEEIGMIFGSPVRILESKYFQTFALKSKY